MGKVIAPLTKPEMISRLVEISANLHERGDHRMADDLEMMARQLTLSSHNAPGGDRRSLRFKDKTTPDFLKQSAKGKDLVKGKDDACTITPFDLDL